MTSPNELPLCAVQHPFFRLSRYEQRLVVIKTVSVAAISNLIVAALLIAAGLWFLIPLIVSVTLSVIAPFVDVPSLVQQQKLRYYACFLLAERTHAGPHIQLHGGTLLDYVYCLVDGPAETRKRQVVGSMLAGIVNLLEVHRADCDDVTITVTSYIFSSRTARRLGFSKQPTDRLKQLILWLNYANLTACYSVMNRRFVLAPMSAIHTYQVTLGGLREKRTLLETLASRNSG